jgi:hypothetical protein
VDHRPSKIDYKTRKIPRKHYLPVEAIGAHHVVEARKAMNRFSMRVEIPQSSIMLHSTRPSAARVYFQVPSGKKKENSVAANQRRHDPTANLAIQTPANTMAVSAC